MSSKRVESVTDTVSLPNPDQLSIFLRPIWEKALRAGLGLPVERFLLTTRQSSHEIGSCVVHCGRRGIMRAASRPFATLVNLQWHENVDEDLKNEAVRNMIRQNRLLTLTLREQCVERVVEADVSLNYRQDLLDQNRWKKYSAIVRRNVKKGISKGIVVEKDFRPADFYRLFARGQLARLRTRLPFNEVQFCKFAEILAAEGKVDFFFARNADGKFSAAHAVLRDSPVAYGILSQRNPEVDSNLDNYLLVHAIFECYAREAFHAFDHCGANIAEVREFKRRFSPQEVWLRTRTHGLFAAAQCTVRKWFKG